MRQGRLSTRRVADCSAQAGWGRGQQGLAGPAPGVSASVTRGEDGEEGEPLPVRCGLGDKETALRFLAWTETCRRERAMPWVLLAFAWPRSCPEMATATWLVGDSHRSAFLRMKSVCVGPAFSPLSPSLTTEAIPGSSPHLWSPWVACAWRQETGKPALLSARLLMTAACLR